MNPLLSYQTRWGLLEMYPEKPMGPVVELHQVHSNIFHPAVAESNSAQGDGFIFSEELLENSAVHANSFGLKTADCLPVLIEGERGWALAHLGWRGLAQKMIQQEQVAQIRPTHLWIGPHICGKNYEVQEEFTKNFPQSHNFFEKEGKLFFDLEKELLDQCSLFGSLETKLSSACTFESSQWRSFRREQNELRNWTIFTSR